LQELSLLLLLLFISFIANCVAKFELI